LKRSWPAILPFVALLSGCSLMSLPSQNHPVCSWGGQPPANNKQVCDIAFATLSSLVKAELRADNGTIHRLVPVPRIASRIIAYGNVQRAAKIDNLHVVPSMTVEISAHGYLGAGFFIVGKSNGSRVSSPETVYVRIRHGHGEVVGDQPNQDW
jgi:hypothetical protein